MVFGNNVHASSSTSYSSISPYLIHSSDGKRIYNSVSSGIDSTIFNTNFYHRYLNIPLRIATYCDYLPGYSNNSCNSSFNSNIQMGGISNGSITDTNPHKYYGLSFDSAYAFFSNMYNNEQTLTFQPNYFNYNNDFDLYSQTHKQSSYYIEDSHSQYYKRNGYVFHFNLSDAPVLSSNVSQPGFNEGNILFYKMRYMIGPNNGNYADGTWSYSTPEYDPVSCPNCYDSLINSSYTSVENNALLFYVQNGSPYNDYDNIIGSWFQQNLYFSDMFDHLTSQPGCTDDVLCGNSSVFQASNPMTSFLNNYSHTFYDASNATAYYRSFSWNLSNLSWNWYQNSPVYGFFDLIDSSSGTVVNRLSTSVIIQANPYNYVYEENNNKYYGSVWFLDVMFFGYLNSSVTNFDHIAIHFSVENQMSTYPGVSQLDLINPESQIMVIGSGSLANQAIEDISSSIIDVIDAIPVIGPFLSIFFEIILFCISFVFNIFTLFYTLPSWFRSGFYVILICFVAKIIHNLIRGG